MYINVVHWYSHSGETLLRITYNALGVKLTVRLQVFDGCARFKAKSRAVRINHIQERQIREKVFVDMAGPFTDILIGNRYWIGVVDDYSRFSWSLFTKTKSQLPKKIEEFFKNMTSHGTPVK